MSYREEAKEREATRAVITTTSISASKTLTVVAMPPADVEKPSEITCQKCGKRPGWGWWAEGVIGYVHGCKAAWCEQCVVDAQLAHAYIVAAGIPSLEKRLRELLAENKE